MARGIILFAGRLKNVQFTWRSGASSTSDPLDLTDAVCAIYSHNLTAAPTLEVLDAPNGVCEISFSAESSRGLKAGNRYWIMISLTFNTNPGYSPDPIKVEVFIQ